MTVTAPAGFEAAGIAAGLKRSGALDLAVVVKELFHHPLPDDAPVRVAGAWSAGAPPAPYDGR